VIFLSILVARLPAARQRSARIVGLLLAMLTRLALLFSVVWLTQLTAPLFTVCSVLFRPRPDSRRRRPVSAGQERHEIHHTLEGAAAPRPGSVFGAFHCVVIQIALIDVVFSLDSVFTAVGLARPDQLPIMAAAIVLSILVMLWLSGPIAAFVAPIRA
jgi:predicted tellurium resistance membrane protein TerC